MSTTGTSPYDDIKRAACSRCSPSIYSDALQQTLYEMGEAVLEAAPEVAEIKFSAPNKHHFLVDLSPFGVENPNEVFIAADRPYGLIEASVVREDGSDPGDAWLNTVPDSVEASRHDTAQARRRTIRHTAARPEDERYGFGRLLAYGTQHILTMYGGVIAPPLIVGGAAGLSPGDMALLVTAGLFVSGLATLLQTLGIGPFGSRLPIVQGISFASVSTMVTIASEDGVRPVFGAIIVAGLIGLVLSSFFAQLVRLFPAVVTGTIITVIGLSLMPVAFQWAMGDDRRPPTSVRWETSVTPD